VDGFFNIQSDKGDEVVVKDFLKGFIKGALETPVGFLAPAIALFKALVRTTESSLNKPSQ